MANGGQDLSVALADVLAVYEGQVGTLSGDSKEEAERIFASTLGYFLGNSTVAKQGGVDLWQNTTLRSFILGRVVPRIASVAQIINQQDSSYDDATASHFLRLAADAVMRAEEAGDDCRNMLLQLESQYGEGGIIFGICTKKLRR